MTGTEPTVDATGGGPGAELPTGQVTDTGLAAPPPPADHRFDAEIDELLEISGIDANVDQVQAILRTTVGLGHDRPARLDLKITNAALAEMRAAFRIFAPYVDIPKVTIFGSARVTEADSSALSGALFDASADAIVVVGGDGTIVLANAACKELLGYQPSALRGKPVEILVPARYPRHQALRAEFIRHARPRPPHAPGMSAFRPIRFIAKY